VKIKVATYNIHKGITGIRGRPRIHEVRVAINAIDADIVFLQEVQDRNERLRSHAAYPKETQLEYLSTSGYEHRAYGMNAVYPHGHHGNAILSRHPIGHFTNHDVSDHALEKRGMLHAVSRVERPRAKPRDIHLICVHLGLINRSRLRQASFLIDFVEREIPPEAPVIIAGDFNDWQRQVDRLLRERLALKEVAAEAFARKRPAGVLDRLLPWRGGHDAQAGVARTFPSFAPWLTLDRIYVRGLRVLSMDVPRGLTWARRSDHAPLIAELELR
jgi:endonuclease/exonuclease/phosphatase family metal-dependent hydrolase